MVDSELTKWQKGVQRQLRIALRTIGVVVIIMMVGFTFVAISAKSQASQRADAARNLSLAIQNERKISLINTCNDTNKNNADATVEANKLPASTRPYVFRIINKLAPPRSNCAEYADSRVKAK